MLRDVLWGWSASQWLQTLQKGQVKRGGGLALYVREHFDCLEVNDGDNSIECLWIGIKGKAIRQTSWSESSLCRMKKQIKYSSGI